MKLKSPSVSSQSPLPKAQETSQSVSQETLDASMNLQEEWLQTDLSENLQPSQQRMVELAGTHVPELAETSLSNPRTRVGALQQTSAFGLLQQVARVEEGQQDSSELFAAIDLGSNSAKMLIIREQSDGSLSVVRDHKIGTRLGKGVTEGDPLPDANQQRTIDALKVFLEEADSLGLDPTEIGLISTAAVRNSSNGSDFIQRLKDELGLTQARILSGPQEAEIGYLGTLAALRTQSNIPADARFATLDLGGGSFQLAVGTRDTMEEGNSTQLGSNYILDEIFPSNAQTLSAEDFAHVDKVLLEKAPMPLDAALLQDRTLVATGGVSKFLRAHFQKDTITRDDIDALRREMGAIPEGDRVDIIQQNKDETTQRALGVDNEAGALDYGKKLPASASLLLHIMNQLGLEEVTVSATDARHAVIHQIQVEEDGLESA
ncbi:MAG: hypothetical protein EP343_07345 [Deltaproteobacteria bacterium]|nr:MAG: hypothetical protein EP343_07345 [Deltaproteobacteria bacterium]